jgi:putative membrane protein
MILIHFAGGIVHIDQKRLYDNIFFSIRFDKYAHFINSLIGAILVDRVLHYLDFRMKMLQGLVIILIVLGVGAFIEISEYIVMKTIPGNGVGGYDNNMQDLIANLSGSAVYIMLKSLKK